MGLDYTFALLNRLTPIQPESFALRVSSDGFCQIVSIVKAQATAQHIVSRRKKRAVSGPLFLFPTPPSPHGRCHSERSRPIFSSFFVLTKKLAGAVEESLFALRFSAFSCFL
jgi:hypothetical protein